MADPRRSGVVWRWPLALAISEACGLAAALLGGPGWAWASWLGLGAPLLVIAVRIAGGGRPRLSRS